MQKLSKRLAVFTAAAVLAAIAAVLPVNAQQTIDLSTITPGSGPGYLFDGILLAIQDGADITLTGAVSNGRRVEVSGDVNLTLDGLAITGLGAERSALLLAPGASLTLHLAGTNTLTAGTGAAGLHLPGDASLTIAGTGVLTATGGADASGIGANRGGSGTIAIHSGTVTATGETRGIGADTINIYGGTINATATASNIGRGMGGGSGSVININGGTVTAYSSGWAWTADAVIAIGGERHIININGGVVTATGSGRIGGSDSQVNISNNAQATAVNIGGGRSNISIGDDAQVTAASIVGFSTGDNVNISGNASVAAVGIGTAAGQISISDNAEVSVVGEGIWGSIVTISGDNIVEARTTGSEWTSRDAINGGISVTIGGGAQVTAEGLGRGAGINGGSVSIGGDSVVSAAGGTGTNGGAGISGSSISISGSAEVAATGHAGSAGIGGSAAVGGVISIGGSATVTSAGGDGAAGIGGGRGGAGGAVTIDGSAAVTAQAGDGGAGIGGGLNGAAGRIRISGEPTINAAGIGGGLSIGRGFNGAAAGSLVISDSPAIIVNRAGEIPFVWFEIHPMDARVAAGTAHSLFPVMGTHITNNLTFQWFSNTTNSNIGGTVIPGAASPEFPIPADLALGTYYYFVEVRAAGTFDIFMRSRSAAITVVDSPIAPEIVTDQVPEGILGAASSYFLQTTGTAPITWTLDAGQLPPGLNLNENLGVISGIPTHPGTFDFSIRAANSMGSHVQSLSVTVTQETVNLAEVIAGTAGPGWSFDNMVLTVEDGANLIITGTVANGRRIAVLGEANITLDNVSVTGLSSLQSPLLLDDGASLTLELIGTNTFAAGADRAGIQAPGGTFLTITGEGGLTATGGNAGAGIGGGRNTAGGNITISAQGLTAIAGNSSTSAIGAGQNAAGGTVRVLGEYDFWTNEWNSAPWNEEPTGTGIFANDASFSYVRLVRNMPVHIFPGDVNNDGVVNITDLTTLRLYLAGHDVAINLANADLNNDAYVNAEDADLLRQYLAGLEGILGQR